MKNTTKNSTTLLEPNWELRASRQTRAKLLLKIFPGAEWRVTNSPDNRSVRWAISELEANGVAGDDFVMIERGGGEGLRILKGGGGRFNLQASGGARRYLISARWLDSEETLQMAETYNSGRNEWMYSSKWEEGFHADPVEDQGPGEDSENGERATVLSVAFLPAVGIFGIVLGGATVGGVLGVLGLTAVAAAITAYPILAKRVMARIDGKEVQDDAGGMVRIS